MINKLHHKVQSNFKSELDDPPPPYRRPMPLVSTDPSTVTPVVYSKVEGTIPKFELRFLNNVCNVDQFTVYQQFGRNVEWIEPDGYKLFNCIQRRGGFMLDRLVSDWIKDRDGVIWLIGVKSFEVSKVKLLKHLVYGNKDIMSVTSKLGKRAKML